MRIGQGFDVHALAAGRRLVIGGVEIPHSKGLAGHSDADVLLHAICDALLGAAALGDIGMHFPDSDPGYKGADSRKLLKETGKKIAAQGFRNVMVSNFHGSPRHFLAIEQACDTVSRERGVRMACIFSILLTRLTGGGYIASDLELRPAQVSIKATTTEGLGYAGRGEGIAAQAIALLEPLPPFMG